jgi:hypothetical protein
MRESKECVECGGIYFRAEGATDAMWEARRYCGSGCAGKAAGRRNREKKVALEGQEEVVQAEGASVLTEVEASPEPARPLVERDLRIVRVGPNPRMILCEYYELAERRTCVVDVKRNGKYVRGMRLKMAEPKSEEDYRRPWVYVGRPPRHRGKW